MTKKQFCKRLFWQTLYVDLDDLCLNTFELEYPRSLVHPLNMEGFWLSDKFRIMTNLAYAKWRYSLFQTILMQKRVGIRNILRNHALGIEK